MHKFILGAYKNLNLAEPKDITESDLEKAVIESIINTVAIWSKHNAPVEKGDIITIKVEARENGVLVPEFCQNKMRYTVGDPNYLKEFLNSIGKKHAESFSMEIEFDENCAIERIRNKKVEFHAVITDISHTKTPEIDDELVRKIDPDCHNLDEIKEKYASILRARASANIEEQKKNLVLQTIIDNSSCEFVPEEFEQTLNSVMEQTRKLVINSNTPSIEQFISATENDDYFRMDCEEVTRRMIVENLVINEISNIEQIVVTAEELTYKKAQYTEDEAAAEEFRKYFPTDQSFELFLLKEKVLNWLCQHNFAASQPSH